MTHDSRKASSFSQHHATSSGVDLDVHEKRSKRLWLLGAAIILLLFFMLGGRDLWTLEWRWANIAHEMLIRHNYLHPYLEGSDYYDKPLLSYWLIIIFSWITHGLNNWAIRLPSALSGFITICCTFYLAKRLFNRDVAYLAAWLLLTTIYFVFWSRVAGVEIINIVGIMLALVCYFNYRDKASFSGYVLFFMIIALSCLMKGLVAGCIVALAVVPDILHEKKWKKHLNWKLFAALIPALIIYLLPFILSSHFGGQHYQERGLYEVFRENVVRYFKPFDHENPFYIYFAYMPLYTFPWILAFIPAAFALIKRRSTLSWNTKWMWWVVLLIFLFFAGSGSRRSYYIIPIIPFVILVTAEWLHTKIQISHIAKKIVVATAIISYVFIFAALDVLYPISNQGGGIQTFAKTIRHEAVKTQDWQKWHIVMYQTKNIIAFYLKSPNLVTFIDVKNPQKIKTIIDNSYQNTIIVTNKNQAKMIEKYGKYKLLAITPDYGHLITKKPLKTVALIPESKKDMK